MYNFTGFSEKANMALNKAVECAEDLGHTYIGSEHLLSGLAQESDSIASRMLQRKGINPQKINSELFSDIKKSKRMKKRSKVYFNLAPAKNKSELF